MAATTLTTSLELIRDYRLRVLMYNYFIQSDPFGAMIPFIQTNGGYSWTQPYTSEPGEATNGSISSTLAASAFTSSEQSRFLNLIYKMDQRNYALSTMREGDGGHSDHDTKQAHIFAGLSKGYRHNLMEGAPATVAIGATLAALFGADAAVEQGFNLFTFADVHDSSTTAKRGKFNWVQATATLSYKAPGDDEYGEGVVISTDNYFRVPLYSGGSVAGSKNYNKFVYVTVTPATILASGNYTSSDTALTTVTFTPALAATGLYYQVTPERNRNWDLSTSDGCPNEGGPLTREALTWMKMKLLDASNDQPSRVALICNDNLYNYAEGMLASLGTGVSPFDFMGTKLNALNYGGMGIFRNPWIRQTISSRNGAESNLTYMIGVVMGSDHTHVKYNTFAQEPTMQQMVNVKSGAVPDDETLNGKPLPIQYWEDRSAANQLTTNMIGLMLFEPVAARFDSLAMIYGLRT